MSIYAQLVIAWAMFKDYLKRVFGGGCKFYTLVPGRSEEYTK